MKDRFKWPLICTLFVLFCIYFYIELPYVTNEYAISGNYRVHFYWMYQWYDNELFQDDLLTDMAKYNAKPIGFKYLYYFLSFLLEPLWISKLMGYVLMLIAMVLFFKIGQRLFNSVAGFTAAIVLLLFSRQMPTQMTGGFSRAFIIPLLASFLYFWLCDKKWPVMLILILEGLLCPLALVVCSIAYGFSFVRKENRFFFLERDKSRLLLFIITILVCFAVLSPSYLFQNELYRIGTLKELSENEANYEGGREAFLPLLPPLKAYLSILINVVNKYWLLLIIMVILLGRSMLGFPKQFWLLILSVLLGYFLACKFAFKLYLPDRYTDYFIPFIITIFFSVNLAKLISIALRHRGRAFAILCIGLCVALTHFDLIKRIIKRNITITKYSEKMRWFVRDHSRNKELYDFLASLPKDAMIAGHPDLMSDVPAFAKRKVFVNRECTVAFFPIYYKIIEKRTKDLFLAYYAENIEEVEEFCRKNGITHLVIDKKHFSPRYLEKGDFYFDPINGYVIDLVKGRRKFALDTLPSNRMCFKWGRFGVMEIDKRLTH